MGKYTCSDNFMIRTPLLPIEDFQTGIEQKSIFMHIANRSELKEYFRKALYISSKSLYSAFVQGLKNDYVDEQVEIALLKYYIRASTRPTPFGYFSAVAMGSFGDGESIVRKHCNLHIDIDHKWIVNIISKLEEDIATISKIPLKSNLNCYVLGTRYYNPYCSNMRKEYTNREEESDIKYLDIVKYILNAVREEKTLSEISAELKVHYKTLDEEKMWNIFNTLIENEYIYTKLRIPSYVDNELQHLFHELTMMDGENILAKKIYDLGKKIKDFNLKSKCKNIHDLENITIDMESICEKDVCLKADTSMVMENAILSKRLKPIIERYAELLGVLSIDPINYNPISSFVGAFQDEFGVGVEVSVIELINPHGFNALRYMEERGEKEKSIREEKIVRIIRNKIMKEIFYNNQEINFVLEDFKDIEEEKKIKWPKSFDLNLFITENKSRYRLYAGPNVGAMKAGAMFQRFSNILPKDEMNQYNQIYKVIEEKTVEEYISVAMHEEPSQSKVSNIFNRTENYKDTIVLGTYMGGVGNEIELNDLYIGVDFELRPYIKSKKYNKKVKIVMDNMLNINSSCKVAKFLLLISSTYEYDPISRVFDFINLEYEYFPQIAFEGVVVSPKRWIFKEEKIKDKKVFNEKIDQFLKKYRLYEQRFLYLCENDNRLMIDLENNSCLSILYHEYRKKGNLYLTEIEKDILENEIVVGLEENEHYAAEFVFSVYLKENYFSDTISLFENGANRQLISENRKLGIFEDGWIYLKIYGLGNRVNDFLYRDIANVVAELGNVPFFFIRYYDNKGPHIRVRFKLQTRDEAIEYLPTIISWTDKILKNKQAFEICFDNYTREINRYGGKTFISYIEDIFCADSMLVLEILNNFNMHKEEDIEYVYLLGIAFFIKYLSKDSAEALEMLEAYGIKNHSDSEYRKKKHTIIKILDLVYGETVLYKGKIKSYIIQNMQKKLNTLYKMIDVSNNLTVNKNEIVFSLVHMHCNRLTGDRGLEDRYLKLVRCGLFQKISRDKYIMRKKE